MAPRGNYLKKRSSELLGVEVDGVEQLLHDLSGLERDALNEVKREVRAALVPMRTLMRNFAPVRSGKLASSVKTSVDVRKLGSSKLLTGKMVWGGKASATAVKRASYNWGARGGAVPTEGRQKEAYYVHAVAKGHKMPRGGSPVKSNEWAFQAIGGYAATIRRNVDAAVERVASKYGVGRSVSTGG